MPGTMESKEGSTHFQHCSRRLKDMGAELQSPERLNQDNLKGLYHQRRCSRKPEIFQYVRVSFFSYLLKISGEIKAF